MAGPGRPGRPKGLPRTGGRKPGTPNRATREIREIAQQHAPAAILEAARLMKKAKTEAARLGAITIILDRAYGKPQQAVSHSGTVGTYDAAKIANLSDEELTAFEAILSRLAPDAAAAFGDPSGEGA